MASNDRANLTAIIGLFGGGKTSLAVYKMLKHMARGGVVCSNINLRADPFISKKFGVQCGFRHCLKVVFDWEYQDGQYIYISDEEYVKIIDVKGKERSVPKTTRFWEYIPVGKDDLHVLAVIDECHKSWGKNAYLYMPQGDTNILAVLRHLNIHLYIMSQSWAFVWKDMRELTQDYYRVHNLKNGGFGVVGRLPLGLKQIVECFSALFKLILMPLKRFVPDYFRIRKFRSVQELKEFMHEGYPKHMKYRIEVLQSYDSPESVSKVNTANELPNDFRKRGGVVHEKKRFKKGLVFSVLLGVGMLFFGFRSLSDFVPGAVAVADVADIAGVGRVGLGAVSVDAVPVDAVPDSGVVEYKQLSFISDSKFYKLTLVDGVGRVYHNGDKLGGRVIVFQKEGRLYYEDGGFDFLVRVGSGGRVDPVAGGSSSVAGGKEWSIFGKGLGVAGDG